MSIYEALTGREKPQSILDREEKLAEERLKQERINEITQSPGGSAAAGYIFDAPGLFFGLEDYSYGPGIANAIDIRKRRYRENGKLKIDREVLGATEGLEQFLTYEPKQNPNLQGTYQDLLTGKYYDDEGNVTGVEKELRDYVRAIARDSKYYRAGEGAMIATDILGAKGAFTFLKNYGKPILRSLATLGAGLVGMGAGKIPGVKVPKIKGSSTGKFADLSPSVQKKLEGTSLEDLGKGKIESQATPLPGRSLRSDAIEPEQLELIKKYREEGLSALQIAAKPDISYGKTTINSVFDELNLYPNLPTKKIEFEFSGSKMNQNQDLAVANMHVDSILQFLREGEDLSLLDSRVLASNFKSLRGAKTDLEKLPIIQHGVDKASRSNVTVVKPYLSTNITSKTPQRLIDKRNYMLQALEQDKNFVNYAKKNFDGDTSAALDDILIKGQNYNAGKSGRVASENYRTANIYPKIDIIEKKFGKQIAAGKFPSLEQVAKALKLPEEEYAQAGRAMFRYFDAHRGNLTMPDTYKFTTNSKVANRFDDIIKTFRGPEIENFYGAEIYKHYEKLASKNIFGKPFALENALKNYKKANNIPEGVAVDHVGGLRALARNNNSPYVSFVQPLPAEVNAAKQAIDIAMGSAQKTLKNLWSSKKKWKPKEWAAEVERVTQDYRLQVANFKRKNPTVEFFEFTVDKNAIPKGDAFKSAFKDNGYGFIVSDTMDVLGKGNAEGGIAVRRLNKDNMFAEPAGQVGVSAKQRDRDILNASLFGEYLQADYDDRQERKKFDRLPDSMKGPMTVFLEDEDFYSRVREADPGVRYKTEEKENSISEIRARIAEEMIDKKPTKFPLSSFPKLLTENPLTKSLDRQMKTPFLILGAAANDIINKMGGDEKMFNERFPRLASYLTSGYQVTPGTDQEAAYIDGIDEINRALETGVRNLGFNTMDLVLGGIDLTGFGDGRLSERLRENYEKTAKNDPETFMGDMVALLVEFGVPGGLVTKLVTRLQKAMRLKGFNTMTRYVDDDVVGAARLAMNTSNVAKRMGTGAVIFGAADFVGGGPYSSLKRMFPEDATLLPGKPIDTTDLSGTDLAVANFKNRVRFGADGALIGGLFPLLGPPAWALTKGTLALPFKTIPGVNRSVFGGALQLAGVPLKIAADSLAGKIPYTSKTIPLVGEGISYLGKKGATAAQATAAFIGKQVFTRATLGIYDLANARASIYTGIKPPAVMFSKNLPDFQTWRQFSVNSKDPLHQYLAKIDNKLAMFRDIGKLGKDAFATMTQSDLYIRSKSRAVEKYLMDVERIAYKLAKAFEERHQKYGEFETIQKKYLDDVLDFLEGTIRLDQLPKQLQVPANDLRNYTNSLKKEFGELLPTTDPIKYLIDADINSMMRRSFSVFTNNSYAPTPKSVDAAKTFIKDLIKGNNGMRMEAEMAFPNKSIEEAIDEYASLKVADIMHTAKYEMADPFRALENITRKLSLDDLKLVTGDELPTAIKKLLGEEKNLRSSLLQTTGNIIASTSQKKSLDRIAEMGLSNGWLFRTKEEALGKGILNAAPLTDVKGSGFLLNDAIGLYGTPEIIKQLGGYSLFDGFLKSTIYQNILAAKAMVQGGKTLYSPATQMRNVGSAALFALNVGHIGGSASVPQAFKIVMDDIFGPGRNVDKKQLNKFIERKIELGVIDENVVAQELTAILNDLKGATKETGEPVISSFNQLIQRVGNTQLSQYVQRLYAGGDNLWKLYGHEFYISELKQFTKSIDDVKRYFSDIVGREFVEISPKTGGKKTVMEGIEEIAAHLVRDTYPTYSRVPPAIQAIRKLPIGNFISFPAEMLRTSATTLSTSLKHIASGNPGLQSMGYRALFGQFSTLYGINEGVKALGHAFTDVSPEAMRAYQDGLGPSFMENHLMVPLTNRDPVTGEFKAFDLSSYNPYAYVIDPIEGFIRELGTTRMSVDEVEGEVYNRIFDAAGPLMALIEPFTSETILLEPMFDIWARQGRSRNGATIFSPTDDFGTKVSKSFNHILETVAPGFVRSTGQVLNALSLDTKQGRVSSLQDVLIRLLGGSIINVDPVSALDYKAIDIREIRSNAYKTEHFFSKENALERGPSVMAAEFRKIQNEALAAQFEVYKMFSEALNTGLLTEKQIKNILGPRGRNVPNIDNLLDGKFTPVSYSKDALKLRADELYKEYQRDGILLNKNDLKPFSELNAVIREMKRIKFDDLLDENRRPFTPSQQTAPTMEEIQGLEGLTGEAEPVTPQLPNTPTPIVPNANMNPVNPATGLTTTETALLSPGEQAIRQRQKGMA